MNFNFSISSYDKKKKGRKSLQSSAFSPGVFKYMFIVREIHDFKIICLYLISILFTKEYCSFDVTLEVTLVVLM